MNPIDLAGVTGVHIYANGDDKAGDGAGYTIAFLGTPVAIMVGAPALNGKNPPVDVTVAFQGA